MSNNYKFFKKNEVDTALHAGKIILGIPADELGDEYLEEMDRLLSTFEPFLQKDVHTLLKLLNLRFLNLLFNRTIQPFSRSNDIVQRIYIRKFMLSKISLLRTSFVTMKAVCGWSYYSLNKCWPEMEFPGETIGREHLTPTLLFGKEPWDGDAPWREVS